MIIRNCYTVKGLAKDKKFCKSQKMKIDSLIKRKKIKNNYFYLIFSVFSFGSSYKKAIILYYLAFIFAQSFLSIVPYAFGKTVNVLQYFSQEMLGELIFWLFLGVVLVLMFWLFHGPARVVERRVALKIQQAFRLSIYEQITELPLKWHQDHHSGNTITRLNRASGSLYRFSENQFIYIEVLVKFLVSIGFLSYISFLIGFLSFLSSILVFLIIVWFDKKLIPLYEQENEIDNHIGATLFDYISNITTLLALRLGSLTGQNLSMRMQKVWPIFNKETVLNEIKWFTMMMVISIVQFATLIGYIVYNIKNFDSIMIGTVVMIFRYQWDLSDVFYDLSRHYSELVHMATDVRGIEPILDDIKKYAHKPVGEKEATHWHDLKINDLIFIHESKDRTSKIFDKISFSLKRGEKIALIGESGGGKSTLLNILSGFYSPSSVSLCIDQKKFSTLEPLKAITTLIPQDPEIFENTLLFNITMDLEVSEYEIEKAIKLSMFSEVLKTLPLALKTDIREKGLNLSVGQKQRLALARGLFAARFSSLLLLDEPTSSIDLNNERKIIENILKEFSNATIILSLHRLHLLPKFDRIILLKEGQIAADGSAKMLLNENSEVRKLYLSSLGEE